MHHVRLNDALNAIIFPDEDEPSKVIRGKTKTRSKDGLPLELYAPAEGWLGPFHWLESHIEEMQGREHAIPGIIAPRKGDIARACGLAPGVASPAEARAILQGLLALPPLLMTTEMFKQLKLSTHSFRQSPETSRSH